MILTKYTVEARWMDLICQIVEICYMKDMYLGFLIVLTYLLYNFCSSHDCVHLHCASDRQLQLLVLYV